MIGCESINVSSMLYLSTVVGCEREVISQITHSEFPTSNLMCIYIIHGLFIYLLYIIYVIEHASQYQVVNNTVEVSKL